MYRPAEGPIIRGSERSFIGEMGKLTVETCEIEGLKVITPEVRGDARGYFMETYQYEDFKAIGIDQVFVQYPQDKLVRVLKGEVYDVAVDIRPGSKTYGKYFGVRLSAENKKQFFVPKNFAHGFLVLSDVAEFAYKCTDFYHPNDEGGIMWNDPDIGIDWPMEAGMKLIQSEKDTKWGGIREFTEQYRR